MAWPSGVPIEFKIPPSLANEFEYGEELNGLVALYKTRDSKPFIISKDRYQESVKAGRILCLAEFDAIWASKPMPTSPMQAFLRVVKEPEPPLKETKTAGHHWLDIYDSDDHYFGRVVLQWNPGAKRWSHSGMLATNSYIDTKHWKYVGPCPMPE